MSYGHHIKIRTSTSPLTSPRRIGSARFSPQEVIDYVAFLLGLNTEHRTEHLQWMRLSYQERCDFLWDMLQGYGMRYRRRVFATITGRRFPWDPMNSSVKEYSRMNVHGRNPAPGEQPHEPYSVGTVYL